MCSIPSLFTEKEKLGFLLYVRILALHHHDDIINYTDQYWIRPSVTISGVVGSGKCLGQSVSHNADDVIMMRIDDGRIFQTC